MAFFVQTPESIEKMCICPFAVKVNEELPALSSVIAIDFGRAAAHENAANLVICPTTINDR